MNEVVRLSQYDPVYSDGFKSMEFVYVVIRRDPLRFKVFLSRERAEESVGEQFGFEVYETMNGDVALSNLLPRRHMREKARRAAN